MIVAQAIATLCAGIFFGAAVYISLVEHPAALEAGADFAARFFVPMYSRASVMQASLALVGTCAAAVAFFLGAGRGWLLAALILGSVIPFTLLVMRGVNDQLMTGLSGEQAVELLVRWGRLHWFRTVLSGLSFAVSLYNLSRTN